MLNGDIYYGVQFAQSLYLLLWQSGRIHEIPERVFSSEEQVSVCYEGMEKYTGRKAISSFYRDMAEKTRQAGGFYRIDMPATQFIEMSEDGSSAIGHWTTMTRVLHGVPSEGNLELCIGQFTNEYVQEDRIWRLKHVKWKQLWKAAAWETTPDRHLEAYCKEPKSWLSEVPELTGVSMDGVTLKTMETLALRNEIYSWFYRFNVQRDLEWEENCLFTEDKKRVRNMLQDCHYVLATSPVIQLDEGLSCGEAFYSIAAIKGEETLTYIRGALYMQLKKEGNTWRIQYFGWYPYATLDPW